MATQAEVQTKAPKSTFEICRKTLENTGSHTVAMCGFDSILDQFMNDKDFIKGEESVEQVDFDTSKASFSLSSVRLLWES